MNVYAEFLFSLEVSFLTRKKKTTTICQPCLLITLYSQNNRFTFKEKLYTIILIALATFYVTGHFIFTVCSISHVCVCVSASFQSYIAQRFVRHLFCMRSDKFFFICLYSELVELKTAKQSKAKKQTYAISGWWSFPIIAYLQPLWYQVNTYDIIDRLQFSIWAGLVIKCFIFGIGQQKSFKMKSITFAIKNVIVNGNKELSMPWNLSKTFLEINISTLVVLLVLTTVAGLHFTSLRFVLILHLITMSQCDPFGRFDHINVENSKHWITNICFFFSYEVVHKVVKLAGSISTSNPV